MSDPVINAGLPAARPAALARPLAEVTSDRLVDAMRGFAALLVAYFHCRQVTWVGMEAFHRSVGLALNPGSIVAYLTLPIAWGSAGVPIFFVLSGYCIHRSGAARLIANPDYRLNAGQFWLRRFVRIYPVLIVALFVTLALDSISLSLHPASHKILDIGPQAFLVNLFSLQGVAGSPYGSNGALWTLSLEVQFYVVYPLLFALRRRFGLSAVLAAVALVNVVSALTLQLHEVLFFTSYWFSWMLGAWIAEIRLRDTPRWRQRHGYLAAALFTAAGCAAYRFGQYGAFQLWASGFACYLVVALQRRHTVNGPLIQLFSKIGQFSYSLYLIHLPIFVLLASLLFRSTLQTSIWPSFGFMLFVLPWAWLLYRFVEQPSQNFSARLKRRLAS
ncbi:acyltransferase [Burkholderia sp. WAC0059]|uniref:acyltransferase family protein n=1 Tax=Burkholderia sp. WAC0059 TaxID=2066022 RepID=UPI000C7EA160|nr:acyltransferase [Burkholderia sp. WAC0059]PLZ04269.1 acyltransferase [Burkholderia sp. WAC0059]